MKAHPGEGVRLLGDVEFPWDVRPMVRHHHERWDGSGYPAGLAGEEIPLSARILCVADVYDALTTSRAYREAFSPSAALEIMVEEGGSTFEPGLLSLFLSLAGDGTLDGIGQPSTDREPGAGAEESAEDARGRSLPAPRRRRSGAAA